MPEYVFRGRLTLSGVAFYISADSPEKAKAAARDGKYDEVDEMNHGEVADCQIDVGTIEENT